MYIMAYKKCRSNKQYYSSGLGLETCRELLAHGATVYMLIRTPARAENVIKQLETDVHDIAGKERVKYIQVDFSNSGEVKKAGEEFMKREQRLDILGTHSGGLQCHEPQY